MAAVAQASLENLDRQKAPIKEQVEQAAIFAGNGDSLHHGREEWTLRWVLKKLATSNNKSGIEARACVEIWTLLSALIQRINITNVARVLNEHKFVETLALAIEELRTSYLNNAGNGITKDSGSSRKRRRDGSPVVQEQSTDVNGRRIAIGSIVQTLTKTSTLATQSFDEERIQSVLRTTPDIAGGILGNWLATTDVSLHDDDLLKSFLQIWTKRSVGSADAEVLATSCLKSLFNLLQSSTTTASMIAQLEEMIARDIVSPARRAYSSSQDPSMFKNLVNDVVSNSPMSAETALTLVVRCIPTQTNRRRKPNDAEWLQAVLSTLSDIVESSKHIVTSEAITALLQSCADYDIRPIVADLQSLFARTPYAPTVAYWRFVAVLLKLESDVFLTSDDQHDLLPILAERVSNASQTKEWPKMAEQIIEGVLVPLMDAFGKSRKLIDFVRLWQKGLAFLRIDDRETKLEYYMAWEDEALQAKFKDLMEPLLSTTQIVDLVDEVLLECKQTPQYETLVIADAIASAVTKNENIDALGLRLSQFAQTCKESSGATSKGRFGKHLWRCIRRTLSWRTPQTSSALWTSHRDALLSLISDELIELSTAHPIRTVDRASGVGEMFYTLHVLHSSLQSTDATKQSSKARELLLQFLNFSSHYVLAVRESLKDPHNDQPAANYGLKAWRARRLRHSKDDEAECAFICDIAEIALVEDVDQRVIIESDFIKSLIPLAFLQIPESDITGIAEVFRTLLNQMLDKENTRNDVLYIGMVIDLLLDQIQVESNTSSHSSIVGMLYRIPIQVFTRQQRDMLLKWKASTPEVLSLKKRMLQGSILGTDFNDLISLGQDIVASEQLSRELVSIYADITSNVMENVVSAIDQVKNQKYISQALEAITSWLKDNKKVKESLSCTMMALIESSLSVLINRITLLSSNTTITLKDLKKVENKFTTLISTNLDHLLEKPKKLSKQGSKHNLSCYSTLHALNHFENACLVPVTTRDDALSVISDADLAAELRAYFTLYSPRDTVEAISRPHINVSSETGRLAAQKIAAMRTNSGEANDRLKYIAGLLDHETQESVDLATLLSCRSAILAGDDCDEVYLERDAIQLNLSSIYSKLAEALPRTTRFTKFSLICESLESILRNKTRCISQQNIDTTIASVATLCSPSSPHLPEKRAGTVFLHMTHILRTILLSHRMKLQGHLNIVSQVLVHLLHRLYTPLPSNTSLNSNLPSWSTPTSHTLTLKHAQAYTRLLTLLCDPSTSSVSRASNNSLNSATAKAKRLVGQHMPLVVSAFVKYQLDGGLRMDSQVREELVRGVWAIFDVMSVEGRRVLGEGLDASGRAVLSELIKDWTRFGKWKGL